LTQTLKSCRDTKRIKGEFPALYWAAMWWRPLLCAFTSLSLLLPPAASAQAPSGDQPPQTARPTAGLPTFYAHARQVIVEAEVWKDVDKKDPHDTSWIPKSIAGPPDSGAGAIETLKLMRPAAPGLTAADFHVFDNGVEQRINYFKEANFSAISLATSPWVIDPTTHGIWGTLWPNQGIPYAPAATYLIGYIPPAPRPGECRTVEIAVQNHYVQLSRKQYCAPKDSGAAAQEDPKLTARMQSFLNSSAQGSIQVSVKTFTFWSSGVVSLATEASSKGNDFALPTVDFTYAVSVHDSKAPAAVQITTEFGSPYQLWKYPCRKNAAFHFLGFVYNAKGEVEGQFSDTWGCDMRVTPQSRSVLKSFDSVLIPTLFDTQIELRPGQYQLRLIVSDGKNFGRAQTSFQIEPLDANELSLSDVVLNGIVRESSWIIRDAAKITPNPLIPTPLVSKDVEFVPVPDARIGKGSPLYAYIEIYEPLLETNKVDVLYSLKISDLKTGSLVMNTGPMSAADWVISGNAVIPIGLKLAIEELPKGSYRLEIQASDSAGRQTEWRQTNFTVQ
ncbi:MAG: hypothetical protein WB555_01985, partial [Candidatus Korobacteraceae bacterium]